MEIDRMLGLFLAMGFARVLFIILAVWAMRDKCDQERTKHST
jgi:hypothetical protein